MGAGQLVAAHPTIVWSLLLLPVGWGLIQGTKTFVGWLVVGVALVTALAAVAAKEPETVVEPGEPGESSV
jgi:hypothetical protein